MKYTTADIYLKISDLTNNEYTLIGEYSGSRNKINIKHNICNTIFTIRASDFLSDGRRCPHCARLRGALARTSNIKEFREKVFNKYKNEYSVVSNEYITHKNKLLIKHNYCGTIFYSFPTSFLVGKHHCPNCTINIKFSQLAIEKIVHDLTNGEYCVLGEYEGYNLPLKMKHLTCETIFYPRINDFIRGSRCPSCSRLTHIKSKGELKIENLLIESNIKYFKNYTFNGCIRLALLLFDFYLPEYNICIEYDGIQHFKPVDFFGGEEYFQYIQLNDKIKNNFCLDNNIKLIRISHMEFNQIDQILKDNNIL